MSTTDASGLPMSNPVFPWNQYPNQQHPQDSVTVMVQNISNKSELSILLEHHAIESLAITPDAPGQFFVVCKDYMEATRLANLDKRLWNRRQLTIRMHRLPFEIFDWQTPDPTF